MNEQLQQSLVQVVEQATSGVQAGVSFLSEELPDVIHQLLMWKMVESLTLSIFWLLIILISTRFVIKNIGRGDKVEDTKCRTSVYKWTLSHNNDGDASPHIIATAAAVALVYISRSAK